MFINKTMNIHQIWLGGDMPEQETRWTDGVFEGAIRAGHAYYLFGDETISARFGNEPAWAWFNELLDCPAAPRAQVLTLMSDYYRFRVMAELGGLYLDTDYMLEGKFPELDPQGGILAAPEFWKLSDPCTAFLCGSAEAFKPVLREADCKLRQAMSDSARTGLPAWWKKHGGRGILTMWGPKWYRTHGLPAAQAEGVQVRMVSRSVAGHVQWGPGSALTHVGTAHWH